MQRTATRLSRPPTSPPLFSVATRSSLSPPYTVYVRHSLCLFFFIWLLTLLKNLVARSSSRLLARPLTGHGAVRPSPACVC